MISLLVVAALLGFAVYKDFLFVDFQFQIGSFVWGRRLGVKRRGSVTQKVTPVDLDTTPRY